MDKTTLLAMTADIVAAHASSNEMSQENLLAEIQNVFAKLAALGGDGSVPVAGLSTEAGSPAKPAVPLEAAFGKDKIFCMVCGKGMKTLKRHLNSEHGLKPGQYRKQFGIPSGTKLVAPDYAERRKEISAGLNLQDRLVKARAAHGKNKVEAWTAKAPKATKVSGIPTEKRARPAKRAAKAK